MLGALAMLATVRAEKLVTVRSVVDPAYAARRAATRPPPTETFVVARGQYFNAIPMDSYLERIDFTTIAARLAMDMKPQGFLPAKNFAVADLVLVIHWGVTLANESNGNEFLASGDLLRDAADELAGAHERVDDMSLRGKVDTISEVSHAEQNLRQQATMLSAATRSVPGRGASNAQLLGFENAMYDEDQKPFTSSLGDTLRLMVNEERYFVIVMAYDARELREGKKRRVWTTRASIRAAGVNFAIALDRLSSTAASYHAVPQSGLVLETSTDRPVKEGTVTIGEIKVLGETAKPPATKSK